MYIYHRNNDCFPTGAAQCFVALLEDRILTPCSMHYSRSIVPTKKDGDRWYSFFLCSLCGFPSNPQLRPEDHVPEAASHAEAVFEIFVVMVEMIFLELLVEGWESAGRGLMYVSIRKD